MYCMLQNVKIKLNKIYEQQSVKALYTRFTCMGNQINKKKLSICLVLLYIVLLSYLPSSLTLLVGSFHL